MPVKTEITHKAIPAPARPGSMLMHVLTWLEQRDRRYRAAQKLRNLPDERLEDMGMTRADAETAYRR